MTAAIRAIALGVFVFFICGCTSVPVNHLPATREESEAIKEVMRRKDEFIFLSSPELDPGKPILLLLHGATTDPREMMDIAREWRGKYNVVLYAFNFRHSIGRLAAHLVRETKRLRTKVEAQQAENHFPTNMTVVTYSYSAAIFRKAVLIADDRTLFSGLSLIQIVPTAGGSNFARGMKNSAANFFVSLASPASAVENPYGSIAAELWGEEGSRKFFETINPARIVTIRIEGDPNSLADFPDKEIHRRYISGIGTNVIVIPKDVGASHEYFPIEPVALGYLRKLLE